MRNDNGSEGTELHLARDGGKVHPTHARVAEGPVVTDADDHERVVRAELAKRETECVHVRVIDRHHDKR